MGKRKRGEEKPKVEGEYDLPPKHTKAVHIEANKKRLIVVLHGAQLETVKVSLALKVHARSKNPMCLKIIYNLELLFDNKSITLNKISK